MAVFGALSLESYAVAALLVIAASLAYLFQKPTLNKNAPPLDEDALPIIGSPGFFTERWEWFNRATRRARNGNFTFWAGQWPVIALSGEQSRKFYFEEKRLGFSEGYATLLGGGGAPTVKNDEDKMGDVSSTSPGFANYFNKRMVSVIRPTRLAKNLPQILRDARSMFDQLAEDPSSQTDVFESVFRMVFKFTMRTVACNEIADDPTQLERTMKLFEELDTTATPTSIRFPWMPTLAKVKRYYVGAQLYKIVNDVVRGRQLSGSRNDDTLQFLLDEGDKTTDILTFILGALFAGQLNSGINTAYIMLHFATSPPWMQRVREEVNNVADRYAPDNSLPLADRLMQVPVEAWETDFPVVDMCLRETIRMYTMGTTFRKNMSGEDLRISKHGTEVIPKDAYLTYAVGDVHYNPNIYEEPDLWDPSRYEPHRAEDKKETYAYIGWGVARHPCLGMRFAKIENNIVVAMFMAYFENLRVVDPDGQKVDKVPAANRNHASAHKPTERVFLRYDLREEKSAA